MVVQTEAVLVARLTVNDMQLYVTAYLLQRPRLALLERDDVRVPDAVAVHVQLPELPSG
jgi:hypothetical protein